MATIITISGKAEAGKDTFATMLRIEFGKHGLKTCIPHFADYLKFIAKNYYGWDGQKDEKGRQLLQYLGTDKVREQIPDFWADTIRMLFKVIEDDFDFILIPDTRFPNELNVREDAINVWIDRPNHENKLTPKQRMHPSETALDEYRDSFHYEITNLEGLDNLRKEANSFKHFFIKE